MKNSINTTIQSLIEISKTIINWGIIIEKNYAELKDWMELKSKLTWLDKFIFPKEVKDIDEKINDQINWLQEMLNRYFITVNFLLDNGAKEHFYKNVKVILNPEFCEPSDVVSIEYLKSHPFGYLCEYSLSPTPFFSVELENGDILSIKDKLAIYSNEILLFEGQKFKLITELAKI